MNPNQQRLIKFLWVYEIAIISICALGALMIATSGGGSIMLAIPVLLVAVAESLRVPLAAWILQAKFMARVMGAIILLAISVVSAEGLALIFETALQNRITNVVAAQSKFASAQKEFDAQTTIQNGARDRWAAADAEVRALDARLDALVRNQPQAPGFSGKTCGATHSTCAADRSAQETYRIARRDFEAHKRELETARTEARKNAAELENKFTSVNVTVVRHDLDRAKNELEARVSESPMHRLAAAWFGVTAADLVDGQFQTVKRFIVMSLAIAFSTLSALLSLVAFSAPRPPVDPKTARSWRALLARMRKLPVRVVTKTVETPGPERVVIKYIPIPSAHDQKTLRDFEAAGDKIRAFREMI